MELRGQMEQKSLTNTGFDINFHLFYVFLRIDNHPQCVTGVYDFPSALLFSVETMTTIGVDFTVKTLVVNGSTVKLQIWYAMVKQ